MFLAISGVWRGFYGKGNRCESVKEVKGLKNFIKRLHKDESGQGMAEYAIILVVIALAAVVGFTVLGGKIDSKVRDAGDALSN